jgi:hypothetical protein
MLERKDHRLAIPCRDVAGRRRRTFVTVTSTGRVVMIVPPGEVAEFAIDEAHALRSALHSTVIAADPLLAPMTNHGECQLPCHDALGRERVAELASRPDGRVMFSAPPAGVAVFLPLQVGALRGALRAAIQAAGARTDTDGAAGATDIHHVVAV